MKKQTMTMPSWLQSYLLATLVVIIVVLPIHAFISTWGGTEIGPIWFWKSWKELLLIPAVVITGIWALSQAKARTELLSDHLIQLIVAFSVIVLAYTATGIASNGKDAALAGLAFDLRYFVMFVLAYILFRYGNFDTTRWIHVASRAIVVIGVALAVVGILQVTIIPRDFLSNFGYEKFVTIAPYLTIDEKDPDLIRAFATLRGPNDYGAYLTVALAFALVSIASLRNKIIASGVIAAGIFASHSRSAYLAAIAVVGLWILMTLGVARIKRYWKYGVLALLGIVLVAALTFTSPTVRLIVFHSADGETLTEGNIDAHGQAIIDTSERVGDNPLGCGTGCSGPASYYGPNAKISENYFLQIAEEYGVVGFALWIAIFIAVMRRLYAASKNDAARALYISGIGLTIIGVLLHVWADDPLSMTWWGIAGAVLGVATSKKLRKALSLSRDAEKTKKSQN